MTDLSIAQAFHFNKSLSAGAATAVSAGCDIDCGGAYTDGSLESAVNFAFKMMNSSLKMMDFVLKMMVLYFKCR